MSGASSDLGASQSPPRISLRPAYGLPATPGIPRRPSPARKGLGFPKAGEGSSHQWPGPLPASFPTSVPGGLCHPRPEPSLAAVAGWFAPRCYLAEQTRELWAPGTRSSGPGSREQEAAGAGEEDEVLTAGVGGRGAPGGWEDGAQSLSWTRDVLKAGEGSSFARGRASGDVVVRGGGGAVGMVQ